jgi:hypothetical protein
MEWLHGPINDHAIFWFGLKVFWWKRFITFGQLLLGSSIFLTLVTTDQKQQLHAKLVELREKSSRVVVPPVVRFRTLLTWFAPIVVGLAAVLALLTHVFITQGASRQPISFWGAWLVWLFLLALASAPLAQIILALSVLRTGLRGVQRYVPPVLERLLHHRRFDRNVTLTVFVLLTLVTVLQIVLS